MRVAAIQFKADKNDLSGSQKRLLALCEEAAAGGASLIVCPEMAMTGYLFRDADDVRRVAEPVDGQSFSLLSQLAAARGCTIVCGYPEVARSKGQDRFYNSAWIIGTTGELLYNYRKRLLYDADKTWASPGDKRYPLVARPFGSLTAGICMDLNDDDFTDYLQRAKARVIAFCTNWLEEGHDLYFYWRYRLSDVPSYFVAANTYGDESCPGHDFTSFAGQSAIFDPKGRLLASAPRSGDVVLTAQLSIPR